MIETLIVGGLTIDHFADGSAAPGGSVIHSGLAAAAEHSEPAFLTVAGDEPEARDGLRILSELGTLVHQRASRTITYRHGERNGRRVLELEASTDRIDPGARLPPGQPGVALLAPIADELPASSIEALRSRLSPALSVLLVSY